jgi:hypothetical protein
MNAPLEVVWPRLVQTGQGRAGLCSFDGVENLVYCDIHRLDGVASEYQQLSVCELVWMGREGHPASACTTSARLGNWS